MRLASKVLELLLSPWGSQVVCQCWGLRQGHVRTCDSLFPRADLQQAQRSQSRAEALRLRFPGALGTLSEPQSRVGDQGQKLGWL